MWLYKIEEKIIMIPIIIKTFFLNIKSKKNNFKSYKYGENIKQYYRVYEGDLKKPTIVFVHGGGWWHGSPKTSSFIGKFFNDLGYNVVVPAYRLVPLYKYPTQINDVFTAVKDYLQKYNNTKELIVIGFSAGGELSTNLVFNKIKQEEFGINRSIFKGLITLSGVLDFNKCTSKHSKTLIENYVGFENEIEKFNPIDLVNENVDVKVLSLHGDRDTLINKENSISFVERIKKYNGSARLSILTGKHHSDIISLFINKGEKGSKEILDFIEEVWKQ